MSKFRSVLEQLLDEEITSHTKSMIDGGIADFSDFRWRVGVIYGLRKALELADDAESKLNKS